MNKLTQTFGNNAEERTVSALANTVDAVRKPKLNEDMRLVLESLALNSGSDWNCKGFASIASDIESKKLDRKRIRFCCRALTRKGLAEFHRGLWTEDGEPAGSGYCCTEAGRELIWNAAS